MEVFRTVLGHMLTALLTAGMVSAVWVRSYRRIARASRRARRKRDAVVYVVALPERELKKQVEDAKPRGSVRGYYVGPDGAVATFDSFEQLREVM